ncbi:bestrophin family protein [Tundrisphaera lichenicola]|uniref:bestrophin family protein n=1 Tax=Tundrisphaera lichenicola TaxID=2029860 RepID=UPI003EBC30BD
MIEYSPNRDWWKDLGHLGTSWTLQRIVRAVMAVGIYSAALSFVILRLDLEGHRSISGTFSLLGVILSIVLVFRTNSAYDRWWEGRKLWGALVNHSRNLAIGLDALIPVDDGDSRDAFARLIRDFALALSGHLRGKVDPSIKLESGRDAQEEHAPGHVPSFLSRAILLRIYGLRRDGVIDGLDVLALKPHTQALLDVAGACERIRKTPIPFSYSAFIKLFVVLYAAILPVGLVPEYGYLAVPLVMLVVFALLGLELMAEEIEDPFGLDCNDLATGSIARMIGCDVAELLGTACPIRDQPAAPYSKVF